MLKLIIKATEKIQPKPVEIAPPTHDKKNIFKSPSPKKKHDDKQFIEELKKIEEDVK